MPEALTLELDDDGNILGDVPVQIDTIFKRIEAEAKNTGRGEGAQQAAKEAQKQIEDAIRNEKARLEAMAPLEKQQLEKVTADYKSLADKLSDQTRESERQRKLMEEANAKDIIDRTQRLEKREARIRALTQKQIRAEAMGAGARDESLDELEIILGNYLGYDDDMEPFVKGPDGNPARSQGKAVTLEAFVADYLDKHPHHRKAKPGQRDPYGRAASLSRSGVPAGDYDAAQQRVAQGDRSPQAIMELFQANRAKQQRAAG